MAFWPGSARAMIWRNSCKAVKKPTVDFSFRRPQLKFPRVLEDHAHAAQLVAEHFLSRGFRHFLFLQRHRQLVLRGARRRLCQGAETMPATAAPGCAGISLRCLCDRRTEWQRKRKWLASQMKPAAQAARRFCRQRPAGARRAGILRKCRPHIPEEVAIVGAENYLLAPDAMHTPISSVDTNLEILGYRGAELLDDLMNGKRVRRRNRSAFRPPASSSAKAATSSPSRTRASPAACVIFGNTATNPSASRIWSASPPCHGADCTRPF